MRTPVQRLSSDRTGSVKYSTSCPCRSDSPSEARRAMPMSLGLDSGKMGREAIDRFAFYSPYSITPSFASQGCFGQMEGLRRRIVLAPLCLILGGNGTGENARPLLLIYCFVFSPGGGGIAMSTLVTGPREDRGLSKSAVLPTTNTARFSLCKYFAAARATSSFPTFSIPAR